MKIADRTSRPNLPDVRECCFALHRLRFGVVQRRSRYHRVTTDVARLVDPPGHHHADREPEYVRLWRAAVHQKHTSRQM